MIHVEYFFNYLKIIYKMTICKRNFQLNLQSNIGRGREEHLPTSISYPGEGFNLTLKLIKMTHQTFL